MKSLRGRPESRCRRCRQSWPGKLLRSEPGAWRDGLCVDCVQALRAAARGLVQSFGGAPVVSINPGAHQEITLEYRATRGKPGPGYPPFDTCYGGCIPLDIGRLVQCRRVADGTPLRLHPVDAREQIERGLAELAPTTEETP